MAKEELALPAPGNDIPELTLLSDHPILPHEGGNDFTGDMLDLHERLRAPLDILRHHHTRTPFTIALYGDWGTGKTSAMRWIESQIKIWNESERRDKNIYPHLTTVWFYPWKYHNREDVWRGIIAEVILESLRIKGGPDLPNRLAKAGKQFGKFLGHSFLHALANIKFKVGAKDPLSGSEGGIEFSGQAFKDIYEEYQQTARPHTPFLNDFESQLTEWVRSTFDDKSHRLVLFIDDLDRCLPSVTLEVLEALKLYLNIPGLLFVAGLDRGVIDQIVTQHYKDSGVQETVALRYLDKIFQVEIDVAPSQTKVSTFLDRKIAQLNDATGSLWTDNLDLPKNEDGHHYKRILEDAVRRLGRHNPRDFTRILNSMLITAHAALTTTQREQGQMEDRAALCLRFAQGAQVYLLRRLLHDYTGSGEILLRTTEGQEWLRSFSEIRTANPEVPPPDEEKRGPDEMPRVAPSATSQDSPAHPPSVFQPIGKSKTIKQKLAEPPLATDLYAGLLDRARRIDHALDAFKSIVKYGWDLMLIPFAPAVAASMPKEAVKSPVPQSSQSKLTKFPEVILSAIARSLEIPIQELTPQHLLAVEKLDLEDIPALNISLLRNLRNLREINLVDAEIVDFSWIQDLTNLETLLLDHTNVADLKFLQNLTKLKTLSLNGLPIRDLMPLEKLASIQRLFLAHTQINNVTPLRGLGNLRHLSLSETQVSDIKPIQSLLNLEVLTLDGAPVSDFRPLGRLVNLQTLVLVGTPVAADQMAIKELGKALPNCMIVT